MDETICSWCDPEPNRPGNHTICDACVIEFYTGRGVDMAKPNTATIGAVLDRYGIGTGEHIRHVSVEDACTLLYYATHRRWCDPEDDLQQITYDVEAGRLDLNMVRQIAVPLRTIQGLITMNYSDFENDKPGGTNGNDD